MFVNIEEQYMARLCLRPLVNAATLPDIRLTSGESKTLGRSLTADVVIDEPSLSRVHARLTVDNRGRLTVEDLGSTNGVFSVNEKADVKCAPIDPSNAYSLGGMTVSWRPKR